MIDKKFLFSIGLVTWGGLGFVRGTNEYIYVNHRFDYKNQNIRYTPMVVHGLYGICIYASPITLVYVIYKELYRLEINLRNLEDEKHGDFYNKVL